MTQAQYRDVKTPLSEGIESLRKWYHRVDEKSVSTKNCLHISFVSVRFILRLVKSSIHLLHLVLDPNVKDLYCHHRWEQEQYDRGISCLEAVVRAVLYNVSYLKTKFHLFKFDEYYVAQNSETGHITATSAVDGDSRHSRIYIHVTNTYLIESVINAMPTRRYGCSYLLEAVQSFEKEKKAGNPRDELTMYLKAGIEVVSDVISWWGGVPLIWHVENHLTSLLASDRIEISNP